MNRDFLEKFLKEKNLVESENTEDISDEKRFPGIYSDKKKDLDLFLTKNNIGSKTCYAPTIKNYKFIKNIDELHYGDVIKYVNRTKIKEKKFKTGKVISKVVGMGFGMVNKLEISKRTKIIVINTDRYYFYKKTDSNRKTKVREKLDELLESVKS